MINYVLAAILDFCWIGTTNLFYTVPQDHDSPHIRFQTMQDYGNFTKELGVWNNIILLLAY